MIAPSSRSRVEAGASSVAGTSFVAADPSGIGSPLVAMISFTVTGTPSSGPFGAPLLQRAADALASARAASGRYR